MAPEATTTNDPETRLKELGIHLPHPSKPVANYVPWVRTGRTVYIAGQVPIKDGKPTMTGKVGKDVDLAKAQEGARACALSGLAWMREAAGGSLRNVARMVKLNVFVAAAPGFIDIPKVANGASDLLVEIFGDHGRHARSAVGVAELPLGVPVEIDFVIELVA